MPMRNVLKGPSLWTVFTSPRYTRACKNQVIHTILISHSISENSYVAFEAEFSHLHKRPHKRPYQQNA